MVSTYVCFYEILPDLGPCVLLARRNFTIGRMAGQEVANPAAADHAGQWVLPGGPVPNAGAVRALPPADVLAVCLTAAAGALAGGLGVALEGGYFFQPPAADGVAHLIPQDRDCCVFYLPTVGLLPMSVEINDRLVTKGTPDALYYATGLFPLAEAQARLGRVRLPMTLRNKDAVALMGFGPPQVQALRQQTPEPLLQQCPGLIPILDALNDAKPEKRQQTYATATEKLWASAPGLSLYSSIYEKALQPFDRFTQALLHLPRIAL